MSRTFEVVQAVGNCSRLTVTPTRVTLKVLPAHEDKTEELIEAAHLIADQTEYDLSLRGHFDFDKGCIQLHNGKIRRANYKKNRDIFVYSIKGKFISKSLNKNRETEDE